MHRCRHTFAALMVTAGVDRDAFNAFHGHESISMTLDLRPVCVGDRRAATSVRRPFDDARGWRPIPKTAMGEFDKDG